MGPSNPKLHPGARALTLCVLFLSLFAVHTAAQQTAPELPSAPSSTQPLAQPPQTALPEAPSPGRITGTVTDTDGASIPNATVSLGFAASKAPRLTTQTDSSGSFTLSPIVPGIYRVRIQAPGFSPWRIGDVLVPAAQTVTLPPIQLGIEAINSVVDAITVQDLAEQQMTAEEHQRILGVLPNFFVSYVSNPQPLTRRQKFKLALVVSRDPLTFFTTGITAGIEQADNSFSGYGPGFSGYAQRYAATFGDRIDSTFLGAALLPSLLHQDPRYFYLGHGSVLHRALYAISTVVICKGDNGRWQPNYSNVLGNLGSAGVSTLYYPRSDRHSVQVTVDNTLIGIAEGSVGTLFQEFLLRHLTHGLPPKPPPLP